MCNFGRGHHVEHFLENYFKIGPIVQEMSFKEFLSRALANPVLSQAKQFVHLW